MFANIWPRETASVTAWRAKLSNAWRSLSERDGISSFLAGFQHAQFAPLLYAVVDVDPEAQEILCGGDQRASHYEPEQKQSQRLVQQLPSSRDQHSHGPTLQYHLCLAEHARFHAVAFATIHV